MRQILLLAAALLGLAAAPAAQAWHAYITHWPTQTVAANGGSYTATGHVVYGGSLNPINEASPQQGRPCVVNGVRYCRFLRVVDRTGFGFSWHVNTLYPRLKMISEAAENRVVFTTATGPQALWTQSSSSLQEAKKYGGPGKIVLYSSLDTATSGRALSCYYYVQTAQPGWPSKPDFCGADDQHDFWTAVVIGPAYHPVTGSLKERLPMVLAHELGHAALHLADTYYPHAPNGAVDCGVAAGGDVSIMCAAPHLYDFFSAHDRAAYALRSGHVD